MINVAVEGEADKGVAEAVIRAANRRVRRIDAKGGKTRLDPLLAKYCQAAVRDPWVVFRDSDAECPAELYSRLTGTLGTPPPSFLLRIAHPMSEGWLLADPEGFAGYFGVTRARIPRNPEELANPKEVVLQLCSSSRSRDIRHDMVAPGRRTGPLYVPRVNDFAATHWNVSAAAENSDSLRRAVHRIRQLPTGAIGPQQI